MLNDVNTLAAIQQERYNGFVNQAATRRLLAAWQPTNVQRAWTASTFAKLNPAAAIYGLLLNALQTRMRALRPS